MPTTLFDDGAKVLTREVDTGTGSASNFSVWSDALFDEAFEIRRTVSLLQDHGYKRVALQLPDELLSQSWRIVSRLKQAIQTTDIEVEPQIFVLGDTSYGSCCIDEVAAFHNGADFLVHYGHTCLSENKSIPVQYVFGKYPMEIEACAASILQELNLEQKNGKVTLFCDPRYHHAMEKLCNILGAEIASCSCSQFPNTFRIPVTDKLDEEETGSVSPPSETIRVLGQSLLKEEGQTLIYVGAETSQIAQMVLEFSGETIFVVDPENCICQRPDRKSRGVMSKRFFKIEQAKDARVFGILVGTMGVQGYSNMLNHLRNIIATAGRKSYTFMMGKINANKLANFPIIDAYILVACPENTLIDSKEFYSPVVTPLEVEIALGVREWSPKYSTDFRSLLPDAEDRLERYRANLTNQEDIDAPHFSLVTGGLVAAQQDQTNRSKEAESNDNNINSNALTKVGEKHIALRYSSAAGDFLKEQTFTGLNPDIGDKAPTKAVPGKGGIASGLYSLDDDNSTNLT